MLSTLGFLLMPRGTPCTQQASNIPRSTQTEMATLEVQEIPSIHSEQENSKTATLEGRKHEQQCHLGVKEDIVAVK